MSAVAPIGITIELETLARLLAAAHLHECAEWGEARLKAEDDGDLARTRLVDPAAQHLRHP